MVSSTKYMMPQSGVPNSILPTQRATNVISSGVAPTGAATPAAPAAPLTPMTTTAPASSAMPVNTGIAPQTGLIGAEQAISGGASQATGILGNAVSTIGASNAYTAGGANAAKLQADLSGANGPEAAQAAQAQMRASPAAQYQFEQMQRATERSAAARGGLLGGNVATELQRNAAGIASQDFQNQFANLGAVADRGANMQSQADQIKAGLTRDIADTAYSAGIQKSGLRMDAGRSIAQNATNAANSISQILKDQGMVVSDMTAKDISTITDIIYNSGIQQSMDDKQLAAILANISGGQASTVAQGQAAIGAANAAGTIGTSNAIQSGITQAIGAGLIK
jgi:hypothetical protein